MIGKTNAGGGSVDLTTTETILADLETAVGRYPYGITTTLTNVTASASNPTTISTIATLVFTADSGYDLPDSITVTGATLVSWTKSTGTAVISTPTANVTVTVSGEVIPVPTTRVTSISEITTLLRDYIIETNFNTSAEEKLQFGTLLGNSPCAKIWFRQKPTNLTSEQIVLNFFITGLSSPSAIPALIKLNGTTVFSGNLTLVSNQSHIATCTINTSSGFVAFNELTIEFTDSTQASAYLDYVSVAITGTQNCIILNRDTSFELYGLKRVSGALREYARKYANGGVCYFVGGEDQDFTSALGNISCEYATINGEGFRYVMGYLVQDLNSGAYTFVANAWYEIYITQSNKLYANYTSMSSYNSTYISNVNYAKKSLHNGSESCLEYICCSFQDFSVGIVPFIDSLNYTTPYITSLKINNTNLTNEFIDMIPINNYIVSSISGKIAVGYFLLHKSGNIIFVPNVNSTYALVVGKGRQVTASLQSGGNEIHFYYNVGDTVIKKVLARESVDDEWVLGDAETTYANAKCIYERATGTKGGAIKIFNDTISYVT